MDAYCIKSLDGLYDYVQQFDVVLSYLNTSIVSNFITCGSTKCVNTGNILCKPNADFMKYAINEIISNNACNFYNLKFMCISKITGPTFINNLLRKYNGPSVIKLLDAEYMEPCTMDLCDVTKNTYIKHIHATSWIDEPFKTMGHIYIRYEYMIWCSSILIIFIVIILCICLWS